MDPYSMMGMGGGMMGMGGLYGGSVSQSISLQKRYFVTDRYFRDVLSVSYSTVHRMGGYGGGYVASTAAIYSLN